MLSRSAYLVLVRRKRNQRLKYHVSHMDPMSGRKTRQDAYNKADSEEWPFNIVSQIPTTNQIKDTYHRVTQWPFQCWPRNISGRPGGILWRNNYPQGQNSQL